MKLGLCIGALALVISAVGQHGASMGSGRFLAGRVRGAGLLGMSEVQRELKLTDPQKTLLTRALASDGAPTNGKPSDQQSLEKSVLPILNQLQRARFEQIKIQAAGPLALADPTTATKLKLTAAQKKAVVAIMEKAKPPTTPVTRKNFEKLRMEAGMRRDAANRSLMALLTPAQRTAFENMQGKPFAFPRITIRGMGTAR